jgi:hypothetical protein
MQKKRPYQYVVGVSYVYNNNIMSNQQKPIHGKIITKTQASLLSKCLYVAGISFLGIFSFA